MTVKIVVNGQSLSWHDRSPKIAANSIEFVEFQFLLSEDWEGYEVTAQFSQKGQAYNMLLIDGCCKLPAEIKEGKCSISIFGQIPNGPSRATVIPLVVDVSVSGFVGNGQSTIPPTPDLYAQLLQKISDSLGYAVPLIKEESWWVWDASLEDYVNTGVPVGASPEQVGRLVEEYLKKNPAKQFDIDEETLHLEDHILSVKTVDEPIKDDKRPITSNAVYDEFSKAVALLRTI